MSATPGFSPTDRHEHEWEVRDAWGDEEGDGFVVYCSCGRFECWTIEAGGCSKNPEFVCDGTCSECEVNL